MADPISIIISVVNLIQEIKSIVDEVRQNKESCKQLDSRLQALDPALKKLLTTDLKIQSNAAIASRTLSTVQAAKDLIIRMKIKQVGKTALLCKAAVYMEDMFHSALHRKEIAAEFLWLNSMITEHMQDLTVIKLYDLEDANVARMEAVMAFLKDMQNVVIQTGNNIHAAVLNGSALPDNIHAFTSTSQTMPNDVKELAHLDAVTDANIILQIDESTAKLGRFVDSKVNEIVRASQAVRAPLQLSAFPSSMDVDILTDFEGEEQLGEPGTFGVTFRRQYRPHKRFYAVKQINVTKAAKHGIDKARLEQEAGLLKQLQHPNIVGCMHGFFGKDQLYFHVVMEYVDGGTLYEKIGLELSRSVLLNWTRQMMSALLYMHTEMNIIHRDLKPHNIMLMKGSEEVKIIDFGLARVLADAGEDMTKVGTAMYSSPEKAESRHYDDHDDIWAVACILLELWLQERMTGRPLWHDDAKRSMMVSRCHLVDVAFGKLVQMMLMVDVKQRYSANDCVVAAAEIAEEPSFRRLHPIPKTTDELQARLKAELHSALGDAAAAEDVDKYVNAWWSKGIRSIVCLTEELHGEDADDYWACIPIKRHKRLLEHYFAPSTKEVAVDQMSLVPLPDTVCKSGNDIGDASMLLDPSSAAVGKSGNDVGGADATTNIDGIVFSNKTLRAAVTLWCNDRAAALAQYGHISQWNTSQVTDMSKLFEYDKHFNDDISSWDVSQVATMNQMFSGASSFNQPIGGWDVRQVANMSRMFSGARAFNQPIGSWNVSKVADMSHMFREASAFNQPIGGWDVGKVANMGGMFYYARAFNQHIGLWNVSQVANMACMFHNASFNQPIGTWNVSKVANMSSMFGFACSFNQPIGSWNVGNVADMRHMFSHASTFNQPIGAWNVGNVADMNHMFSHASTFNQPIGSWNVSKVADMRLMFSGASAFNQPIGAWDVGKKVDVREMFEGASSFKQEVAWLNRGFLSSLFEMF